MSKSHMRRAAAILLLIVAISGFMVPGAIGQTTLSILSVNGPTGEPRLAPGSRTLIELTQNAGPGPVTVQAGGRQAGVFGVFGNRVYVLLPFDLPPGPTTVVVTSRGISTPPFPLTLVSHAPVLAPTSFWPGTYCPALAPWGTSLVAYGLGATNPEISGGAVTPVNPPASTVLTPVVKVAGHEAEVVSAILVPGRTNDGSYAVEFRLRPGTPEGHHPVSLTVAGHNSNTDMLRVAAMKILSAAGSAPEGHAAPEAIMSAYACAAPLGVEEMAADPRNPPLTLAGTAVKVRDSTGVERMAPLLYASPRQVNYIIPAGTAIGRATVTIDAESGAASTAVAEVQRIAPNLFAISGQYAAAVVIRVRGGMQTVEPTSRTVNGHIEAVPIDLGPDTDEVFLSLFGTGLRGRNSPADVKVRLLSEDLLWGFATLDLPVTFAGAQAEFAGLDQVNVKLPRSLTGRFDIPLTVIVVVDGKPTPQTPVLVFKGQQ